MSAENDRVDENGEFAIKRRTRIKYNKEQLALLERAFGKYQYPDSEQMEDLGNELGVSADRVAIWFQNRRSKFKRQQNSDHMQWMRKQVFQNETVSSPSLPVFSSVCHVLTPLESQMTRREHPVERSPNLLPQNLPISSCYGTPSQSYTPTSYYTKTEDHLGDIKDSIHPQLQLNVQRENRLPTMNVTPYTGTPTNMPHLFSVYGRIPFQPIQQENYRYNQLIPTSTVSSQPIFNPYISAQQTVRSQQKLNQFESAQNKISSKQVLNQSNSATKPTSFTPTVLVKTESAIQQSVPSRSSSVNLDKLITFVSSKSLHDNQENCKPTQQAFLGLRSESTEDYLSGEGHLKPYTEMSPLKSTFQLNESAINKESQEKLLQQKALECLAQWC